MLRVDSCLAVLIVDFASDALKFGEFFAECSYAYKYADVKRKISITWKTSSRCGGAKTRSARCLSSPSRHGTRTYWLRIHPLAGKPPVFDLRANRARFTLEIASLMSEILVVGLEGTEQLSKPFKFKLELASEDPALEFDKIINQPALLTLHGRDEPRYLHAMISHLEQGNEGERFTLTNKLCRLLRSNKFSCRRRRICCMLWPIRPANLR
jgi:hypothetical protein